MFQVSNQHLQLHSPQPFGRSPVQEAQIINGRLLAQGDDIKPVYEVTFNTIKALDYLPGDTIGILAKNRTAEVDLILQNFQYTEPDEPLKLSSNKKLPIYLPEHGTIRRILTECLDIRSVPKKLFLRAILDYTFDPLEKRYLEILCSKEGSNKYSSLVSSGNGIFLNLANSLKSCTAPFQVLCQHLPRLLPRPYSICTNPATDDNTMRIIFSVLTEQEGLVTTMVSEMIEKKIATEPTLNIYLRQGTKFQYGSDQITKDIILIGPGTGLAPFLSFLSYRENSLGTAGKAWIFTGSRYRARNNLFTHFQKRFSNIKVSEAFSRDAETTVRYVQDQIRSNSKEFVKWIMNSCIVYVCGEGKTMLPSIEKAIVKCMSDQMLITEEEAVIKIKEMRDNGMYIEDVWI